MGFSNGASLAGDLNSTYFSLYYSIANIKTWMAQSNYCPLEIVIVGWFPDARYLSITDNDMHYALAQHLADADIDPINSISNPGSSYANSFTPGISYSAGQQYLVGCRRVTITLPQAFYSSAYRDRYQFDGPTENGTDHHRTIALVTSRLRISSKIDLIIG